jgi:peptide/nickel transport system permease protein
MLAYSIRRLFAAIPILLAASLMVFWFVSLGGDPVEEKYAGRNPPVSPLTIKAERERLGLTKGFWQQYWDWLTNLVVGGGGRGGRWGESVTFSTDIGHELSTRLWVTLRLILVAMLISMIFAIVTGVLSAVRQYSKLDYFFTFLGFVFLAMPAFWIAVLLKQGAISYNDATGSQVFSTYGAETPNLDTSAWGHLTDIVGHMVLPTLSLAAITYAAWSRFTRASMLEVLNSDYVRLAKAKGLKSRRVMVRHALRTALIPMTTVSALTIAVILGGAVITETVFGWQGMGQFLLNSIFTHDRNGVLGWLMVSGFIVVLGNLVADLLYGVLDPRIRYE